MADDPTLRDLAPSEQADDPREALDRAWRNVDANPGDIAAKRAVARLLRRHPEYASAEHLEGLQRLLCDPEVDPSSLASAGWKLLLDRGSVARGSEPEASAAALETDDLAMRLLTEASVTVLEAELALTEVRRWLLLAGRWSAYPRLAQALATQAVLNGGAWPFGAEERLVLDQSPDRPWQAAYRPPPPPPPKGGRYDNAVTQALADDYVAWPYPMWSRITPPEPSTVPREVEKLDGGRASGLPVEAEVLIAGCGTGREAAIMAMRFPDARVTAIDLSAGSLAYAADRCAGLPIEFHLMDLHDVARLGRQFDLITSSGVLHHLPDPEERWAKLVEVLKPGGVMRVMLYSRVARLGIEAAKRHISDLLDCPVDADLLRAVRQRLIEKAPGLVGDSIDFYNLNGVRDLLLNKHEVLFDVPRIARAVAALGLELLAFKLPSNEAEARYRRQHPEDPLFRDVEAWAALEAADPFLFAGMYEFWGRRPR